MLATIGALGAWGIMGCALFLGLNALPPRHVVALAMVVALPLVYLEMLPGRFTLLHLVVLLGLAPRLVMRRIAVPGILGFLLWLLLAVQLTYIPFAVAFGPAVSTALNTLCLLTLAAAVATELRGGFDVTCFFSGWRWVLLAEALLVVAFRLFPSLEGTYFTGPVARWTAGTPAVEQLLTVGNNVLDPVKSGGLLFNANVAAMVLGFGCACVLARWRATRSASDLGIAALAGIAVVMTGSKTGILLLIATPLVYWLIHTAVQRRIGFLQLGVLGVGGIAVLLAADKVLEGSFAATSDTSLDIRSQIWGAAARVFWEAPVLGLTPGGWEARTRSLMFEQGLTQSYPPHNVVIAAWADYGLVGAAVVVAIMATFLVLVVRNVRVTEAGPGREVLLLIGMGVLWVFLHGQGDNTALHGALQSLPPAAVALGFVAAHSVRSRRDTSRALSAPTPVVPSHAPAVR
jgi:O-antigen ligase